MRKKKKKKKKESPPKAQFGSLSTREIWHFHKLYKRSCRPSFPFLKTTH